VLAAAFEVLARHPEASMQQIAEASGLGRTTIYRHFPSRDALIAALFEDVFEASAAAVTAILGEVQAPGEVLPRIAAATITIGDRYGFLAAHRELGAQLWRRPREDPLRDWLAREIRAGALRPLGVEWLQGMLIGMITAAHEEVIEGRESAASAGTKLGETLVAAFVLTA
jgi:AcrR family transcriptional regulator